MARIRTIKPDFWTSEPIVNLPIPTRLFFIGLWNFADDHGGITRSTIQLRLWIFPNDNVDIEEMILQLVASGLVKEYADEGGKRYLHICGFGEHQKIDRPSAPKYPKFDPTKEVPRRGLIEGSSREGKGSGMEGKGKERSTSLVGTREKAPRVPTVPKPEDYVNFVNQTFKDGFPLQMPVWKETYPGVDIRVEMGKARGWLLSNLTQRKKKLDRFMNNWLAREQERSRRNGSGAPTPAPPVKPRVHLCSWMNATTGDSCNRRACVKNENGRWYCSEHSKVAEQQGEHFLR